MSKGPTKKPKLIDWELFCRIRHGDILITKWDTLRAGTYRLVLTGPADYDAEFRVVADETPTSKAYVQVPIHARSWTKRAYTVMNFYDTVHVYGPCYAFRPHTARWACQLERDTLTRLGFDVVRELLREIADTERIERLGLEKYTAECKRWLRGFAERAQKAAQKERKR